MIPGSRKSLLSWLALCVPFVSSIGEEYELAMYNDGEEGYLYNLGSNAYLDLHATNTDKPIVFTRNRSAASPISMRMMKDPGLSYALLISVDPRDIKQCKNGYTPTTFGISEDVKGCPVLQKAGANGEITLTSYNNEHNAWFFFSPVVYNSKHAFRIYSQRSCLTVAEDNVPFLSTCAYDIPAQRDAQLFIWVKKADFIANIHAPFVLNQAQNPAMPAYDIQETPETSGPFYRN
ncbi:hypothetical protein NEHOM01_2295 [Nematocida homosporus]|uniref:uncharacterized protein n=1 Tax=Nematocida homosporus TaxID=1912981 RepID=UPI0022206230|nr:uncharacterized protein NEHOM01_2295 [Nematocida homosporus]KAI5187591.1 hypothetical protein NEHOM01_2295 [Nematocida homosporus]